MEREGRESGQILRVRAVHQPELLHAHIPFQDGGRLMIGERELHLAKRRNRALGEADVDELLQVGAERQNRQVRGLGFERDPEGWLDRHAALDLQGAVGRPRQRKLQRHGRSLGERDVFHRELQVAQAKLHRSRRRQIGEIDLEIFQRHLPYCQINRRHRRGGRRYCARRGPSRRQ